MDVAGAELQRLFEKIVDRANHRRAAGKIPQALDIVVAQLVERVTAQRLQALIAEPLVERRLRCPLDEATSTAIPAPSTISAARRVAISPGSATTILGVTSAGAIGKHIHIPQETETKTAQQVTLPPAFPGMERVASHRTFAA